MKNLPRAKTNDILQSLQQAPAVFINGPRQAGKSTLARTLAQDYLQAEYLTLDHTLTFMSANNDPAGFLNSFTGPVVIDEIQLLPDLYRNLKLLIDELRFRDPSNANGRFLLTGSSNVLTLPELADALVGRMQIHTLYPLSVGELSGQREGFVSALFEQTLHYQQNPFPPFSVAEMITNATFPEVFVSKVVSTQWYDHYLNTLLQRDVRNIIEIEKMGALMNMIPLLATRVGTLIHDSSIAQEVSLNNTTFARYKTLLLLVFLIFTVPPWFNNRSARVVKSPKLFFTDTALLCHLLRVDFNTLKMQNPSLYGRIVENFVAAELTKQLSWQPDYKLYHWRTHDQKEVDFILERRDGKIVALEIKASLTITAHDFKHLKNLQTLLGDTFHYGVILHHGQDIVHFGPQLYAMPLSALWNLGANANVVG